MQIADLRWHSNIELRVRTVHGLTVSPWSAPLVRSVGIPSPVSLRTLELSGGGIQLSWASNFDPAVPRQEILSLHLTRTRAAVGLSDMDWLFLPLEGSHIDAAHMAGDTYSACVLSSAISVETGKFFRSPEIAGGQVLLAVQLPQTMSTWRSGDGAKAGAGKSEGGNRKESGGGPRENGGKEQSGGKAADEAPGRGEGTSRVAKEGGTGGGRERGETGGGRKNSDRETGGTREAKSKSVEAKPRESRPSDTSKHGTESSKGSAKANKHEASKKGETAQGPRSIDLTFERSTATQRVWRCRYSTWAPVVLGITAILGLSGRGNVVLRAKLSCSGAGCLSRATAIKSTASARRY